LIPNFSVSFAGLSSHDYVLKIVPTIYEKLDGTSIFTYQYTWAYKVGSFLFYLFFNVDFITMNTIGLDFVGQWF